MKKIVCELCECTEFTKEGGMFVCQGCGTKYTAEEARGMMQEVEGSAPIPTGASVGAPVGNPNQQQIDNILLLATTAYEAQNYAEAENYCNRAIELDAMCYKAWNLKGKAVGWSSKIDNLRIEEASHSFCKAIDFAPEEEKEELKNQAVEELKRLGLALIDLRKNRFSGSPDAQELNGFTSDKKTIIDSLLVLLAHGNAVGMPEGYLDQVATKMNEAGVAALNMARNAWAKVDHPSLKDLQTYLDWNGNICEVFRQSIATSDNDDEADIQRYKNLNIALEDPMNKWSQKQQWNSFWERYEWVNDYSLNDSAKSSRRSEVTKNNNKINEINRNVKAQKQAAAKKAEEDKKARIKAYWEAHAEEKAALEAEKKELSDKKNKLNSEISGLEKEISSGEAGKKIKVPSEEETDKLHDQIKELEGRRAKLGMFAGKEKKQIGEEIASLEGRVTALKDKVAEETRARDTEVDKKIAPLKAKKDELNKELSAAQKRISAIEAEFTKDPQ